MREDLISSAVSFLSDPKVQSAPLAKKISFLESKGMTSDEIEEAMARSNGKSTSAISATTANTNIPQGGMMVQQQPGMALQHVPPPIPPRLGYDWRDIFIAAVLAGGVGYGVWTLAKRLFGPWFKVPTQKELEEDKEKLDAQFQAVEDSLKEIKDQTNTALTTVTSQAKKVDDSLANLETVLKELKEGDEKRDDEFTNVKRDIDALKELVPKALERNKESQNAVLVDLQNEMKSLKSLLVSRRTATSTVLDQISSAPTSPALSNTPVGISSPIDGLSSRLAATINSSGTRAGIPAWQMANNSINDNKTSDPNDKESIVTTTNTTTTKSEASGSSSTN
ncbi:peroxisomal membrane anchor protein conserved region-domain-containing protein [Cokeromyces recurvatus]|uniref:peroxisomal membrane anchor protein conserved region-domain-containing protein n=1 Tax=Cokeromyces recurvatus TaxID=90255 RepID=UPI00221E9CA6|nr:peroxisomal membrane anchor protein conserved region-domain-containing protein [Cokeromyces recurvatus]KAI7907041.1 peroxisomal membrane anchor protein conserved region-domain-containing protein [Cokeromyces recurvatus]